MQHSIAFVNTTQTSIKFCIEFPDFLDHASAGQTILLQYRLIRLSRSGLLLKKPDTAT